MPITARTLYHDTLNFFRHQMSPLILLALVAALINVLFSHAFSPSMDELTALEDASGAGLQNMLQNMTPEQRTTLLKFSAASSLTGLISNVILFGGVLALIPLAVQGERLSALRAIGASAPMLPRLLLLLFLCTLLIQLGIAVFIVPGLFLAVGLALSPVILASEQTGVIAAIRQSFRLSFANIRLVSPAIMLWLALKLALVLFAGLLAGLGPMMGGLILSTLSNIVSIWLILYLARLYLLLKQQAETK